MSLAHNLGLGGPCVVTLYRAPQNGTDQKGNQ